ncbi:MAG TPA: ABC transporter permease [Polyangia bacterium]|jgi:peptide/nickel transport system permease protein|nr:ABC transporter permease [Polyangia bacterium]
MTKIVRRLATVPATLVGITLVTFALMHVLPGDAALLQTADSRGASVAAETALRQQYGLDRPLLTQYGAWLVRSARLDFGVSLVDGRPVRDKLAAALPTTLALALLAAALAFGVAIPLGVALGLGDRRRWARALTALLYVAYAMPAAALALWALRAGAPYGGHSLAALVPAAACLALAEVARLARYQRAAVLAALDADYVTTAHAKGGGALTIARHALANALVPMVTLVGAELPALVSAAVVVEQIFGLHGIGHLAFDAVLARDAPLLLAITTFGALLTLTCVFAADVAYGLVDPRLRGRAT